MTVAFRWIWDNRKWLFSGVGVVVIVGIVGFFSTLNTHSGQSVSSTLQTAKPAIDAGESPQTSVPPAGTVQAETGAVSLNDIRKSHDVKQIDPSQNELRMSQLPSGVFGFVYPSGFDHPTSLEVYRDFRFPYFEVHKLRTGQVTLIGFVGPDTAHYLVREDRPAQIQLTLYNVAWSDATALVSLPFERIQGESHARYIKIGDNDMRALDLTFQAR